MLFAFDFCETINGATVGEIECRARLEAESGKSKHWIIAGIEVDGLVDGKWVDIAVPASHPLYNRLLTFLLAKHQTIREIEEAWRAHVKDCKDHRAEVY